MAKARRRLKAFRATSVSQKQAGHSEAAEWQALCAQKGHLIACSLLRLAPSPSLTKDPERLSMPADASRAARMLPVVLGLLE